MLRNAAIVLKIIARRVSNRSLGPPAPRPTWPYSTWPRRGRGARRRVRNPGPGGRACARRPSGVGSPIRVGASPCQVTVPVIGVIMNQSITLYLTPGRLRQKGINLVDLVHPDGEETHVSKDTPVRVTFESGKSLTVGDNSGVHRSHQEDPAIWDEMVKHLKERPNQAGTFEVRVEVTDPIRKKKKVRVVKATKSTF